MDEKLITAGIPVYNGEKFIAQTLESIINQTYKNLEIIVSDNGSNDTTVEIVKEFMKRDSRISLNQNLENLGYSGNLNKIIELSNSEYIAIYHADDIYESTIVEEQVKFLKENQELAGCFTLGKVIDENGNRLKNHFVFTEDKLKDNLNVNLDFFVKKFLEKGNIFICPTSMIKKSVYLEMNGYDETLKYIEDQDMWMRILEKYNMGIVAKELINYRIHSQQGSSYYSDKKRLQLPVDILHINEFLSSNCKLKTKYNEEIKKRFAKEHIILSKKAVLLGSYDSFKANIEESKKYYIINDNIKFKIFQKLGNKFSFNILRLMMR